MARDIETSVEGRELVVRTAAGIIRVNVDELDQPTTDRAIIHGLRQKICDAAALGQGATIGAKFAAMKEVADRLVAGIWNVRAEGGTSEGGLLLRALIQLYPRRSREELQAFIAGKSKSQQAALRASSKIAPIIAEIQAARATGIDADALLDGLENEED